jgi:hypothetical protein
MFSILLTMSSCNNKYCDDDRSLEKGTLIILLEQGFLNDSIGISYFDKNLFTSRITTNPSSGIANDFMGFNYDLSKDDKLVIYFNGETKAYSLKKYSCNKTLVIKKQGNQIRLSGTNKILDYQ